MKSLSGEIIEQKLGIHMYLPLNSRTLFCLNYIRSPLFYKSKVDALLGLTSSVGEIIIGIIVLIIMIAIIVYILKLFAPLFVILFGMAIVVLIVGLFWVYGKIRSLT